MSWIWIRNLYFQYGSGSGGAISKRIILDWDPKQCSSLISLFAPLKFSFTPSSEDRDIPEGDPEDPHYGPSAAGGHHAKPTGRQVCELTSSAELKLEFNSPELFFYFLCRFLHVLTA